MEANYEAKTEQLQYGTRSVIYLNGESTGIQLNTTWAISRDRRHTLTTFFNELPSVAKAALYSALKAETAHA